MLEYELANEVERRMAKTVTQFQYVMIEAVMVGVFFEARLMNNDFEWFLRKACTSSGV